MPPPSYMQPTYMGAMDQANYFIGLDAVGGPTYEPVNTFSDGMQTDLGPMQLGMTANPMQNQLAALQAKIREGASKVEFEFAGRQKGNSQASTPESYGKEERRAMRALAEINKIKTSTHATFTVSGLAGFNPQQGGFNKQVQQQTVHEVERAIDFAKDATTGGAIVVHTGEWSRPIGHYHGEEGFELYEGQEESEPLYMVETQTGQVMSVFPGQDVVVPKWHTAKTYEERFGKKVVGKGVDVHGNPVEISPNDPVDWEGRRIDPRSTDDLLFRVPIEKHSDDGTAFGFETETLTWEKVKERANQWEETYGEKMPPEKMFIRLQLENQMLQHKGQSTFHLQNYSHHKERFDALSEALQYYKQLEEDLPEEEKWRLLRQMPRLREMPDLVAPKDVNLVRWLEEEQAQARLGLLHTHEAVSAADARASEIEQRMSRMKTVEDHGLQETGKALAKLADQAMEASKKARKERGPGEMWEDLYIAPENWHPGEYGSHPEELLKIVQSGREEFKKRLAHKGVTDAKKQEELAKKHIKTTLDIGHFNMWRNMMKRGENESEEKFQERFDNWLFDHLKKLEEADAIGHLHLTDNFGFNDEHLSIGQGNAPIKKFVQWMKDRGHTDFIIEPGSFNPQSIMADAWSYLGATNWKQRHFGPSFKNQHMAHAGLYAPPNYIVGSYVPSNEWTLWSGVQLE